MQTQQDFPVRVIAFVNLVAMCREASGVAHRYWVSKRSRSRIHVTYSNPDEYGVESPMTVVLPCYPSSYNDDERNPRVVLDVMRVLNDTWGGEGWQAFDCVFNQYATRDPDGAWRVVPFDPVHVFGRLFIEAQRAAYYTMYPRESA